MPERAPLRVTVLALLALLAGCAARTETRFVPGEVHRSPTLIVEQVTAHTFVHTSFKQTVDFGHVPCNGLVVRSGSEAVVFDTPTDDAGARELIRWVRDALHCRIVAVIPTHFHDDCLGGLDAFHAEGIPSHALDLTLDLARANGETVPQFGFADSLELELGRTRIRASFHGEGHTRDNVVGYVAGEGVLFGGCLVKALGASEGYLGDANVAAWSATVAAVKRSYPDVQVVVPGHGDHGTAELLDSTIRLFQR